MTKTWCPVLAAVLGLTTAALHGAEPPEFLNLPPTEIKAAPLPLDTKAPLTADPKHVPAPTPPSGAYGPACPSSPAPATFGACGPCGACGICGAHVHRLLEIGHRDHSGLEKLQAWLFFRPCQLTPLGDCCCYVRPIPEPYLYFLYPGCHEGDCGGCCKGAAACGCKSCGK
jgi:hypothetical protein